MNHKKLVIFTLMTMFTLSTFPAFAGVNTTVFPATASPGAKIICEEDGTLQTQPYIFEDSEVSKANVISEGTEISREDEDQLIASIKEEAKQLPTYITGDPIIPEAKPGMVASYDGMGYLNKIVDENGNYVSMERPLLDIIYPVGYNGSNISLYNDAHYNGLGLTEDVH